MTTAQYDQLLLDHADICNTIAKHLDQQLQLRLLGANQAWFYAGNQLLKHFQKCKFEHGVVDFNDLEWETYRLLQQEDHALWVQYKLGAQIQHFLVDEFQDTNPVQWHLLKPLIESSLEQHQTDFSSLFLVGDIKQSIYRFRGANPRIQQLAADWSREFTNSREFENNTSWRSAPAVIDCVNRIFSSSYLNADFPSFQTHICQYPERWGRVEIHPLIRVEAAKNAAHFRDPLTQPRRDNETTAHFQEGVFIAEHIQALMSAQTPVYDADEIRPVEFNDILILTRTRSHTEELKAGLRSCNIPLQTSDADSLLSFLEIQDILALLRVLADPLDDICLAQVLRSPLFSASDPYLVALRRTEGNYWCEKLLTFNRQENPDHPLCIAHQKLLEWRSLADRIPVHDLLSHIYSSWMILNRYRRAVAEADSVQVCARLTQLLQLSLEIDSGRYSSIHRFIRKIEEINPAVAVDDQIMQNNCVRLMTVHGAKGLESPIVYLADCGPLKSPPEQYKAVSIWPELAQSPTMQMLTCKKTGMSKSAIALKEQAQSTGNEKLNLLYVALTRAKQVLVISGVHGARNIQDSWHHIVCNALDHQAEQTWECEPVPKPNLTTTARADSWPALKFDRRILQIIEPHLSTKTQSERSSQSTRATDQGIVIHKCLEILSGSRNISDQALRNRVLLETGISISALQLQPLRQEAETCLRHPDTRAAFDVDNAQQILNEVCIADGNQNMTQLNVIDRLIVDQQVAWIIDYKTDAEVTTANIRQHADLHIAQLKRYAQAVAKLYPDHSIRSSILFTKLPALVEIDTAAC